MLATWVLNAQPAGVKAKTILAASVQTSVAKLLTPADVEQITKAKVHLLNKNPALGAVGELIFALEDGNQFVMVLVGGRDMFDQWRKLKGFFHAAVPGVGDEAFDGPDGNVQYVLYIRRGDHSISISSYLNQEMKPRVPQDQLRALAKIVVSRL